MRIGLKSAFERAQFRILYRSFLSQIVDLEIMSVRADPSRLLVQWGALLASTSVVFAIMFAPVYARATREEIARLSWGIQEFLIGTTMAVVGLFAVLAWDSIFPDKRDSLIL